MKKLIVIIRLILSGFLFLPNTSFASHLVGAQIEYVFQGSPNTYLFRLKVYRDCAGITPGNTQELCVSSVSLGFSTTHTLYLISQTVIPNSPCINLPPANCTGGSGVGIEEYVFEGFYSLPNAATDWIFSWSSCCRNGVLTTIGGFSSGMYISTTLDNLNHPLDNSPVFSFIPYSILCMGNPYYYNQSAVDPDGDSLVFSLVSAEDNLVYCPPSPIDITYNSPYSATYPLSSSVPITIDQNSGIMYFIPNLLQVAVVCVLVASYDANGALIGTTKSDVQVVVTNVCNIVNPTFPGGPNSTTYFPIGDPTGQVAGPYYCGDNHFILPFTAAVQCNSIVATDIRVLRSIGIPNPVLSAVALNCMGGETDSIEVTCLYPLTAGTNLVTIKTGADGNTLLSQCGSAMMPLHDTVAIIINDLSTWQPTVDSLGCVFNHKTITFNQNIFCYTIAADGSDLVLKDATGIQISVTSAYGYCAPNGEQSNQLLMNFANMQTNSSAAYYLTVKLGNDGNTIANECGRFLNVGDTLAIFYTSNQIDVDLGSDRSICINDPAPLLISGFSNSGLTYQWYFNASPVSGATSSTYTAVNGAGNYVLTVYINNNPGCNGSDTVQMSINASPVVTINDTMACVGSTIILDAGNSGLGYQYQWYFNGNGLSGETNQLLSVTQNGTYTAFVSNGNCFSYDDAVVSFYQSLVVPSFNSQHLSICAGSALSALDAANPGLYCQWSVNGFHQADDTLQTFTPDANYAGTDTITVFVGVGNCSVSGTMVLTVVDYPVVSINDEYVCEGATYPTFNAGAIPGATYQWTNENSDTISNTNLFAPPTTLTQGSYYYNVSVTVAPGCTTSQLVTLNVDPPCQLIVPNIITPNGDNINDELTIENIERYPNNHMTILNRWGKKVYSSTYDNADNVFKGKGLTEGLYFYMLVLGDSKSEPVFGSLQLAY